eukprot:g34542.t1
MTIILAFIAQNIEYRSWDVMLYRTLVRPLLEHCAKFWLPRYRKDSIKLERVQKRFTSILPGMEGLRYENRLALLSLEHRRLRHDLIEVYKIMRGVDEVNDKGLFPTVGEFKARGHTFKILSSPCLPLELWTMELKVWVDGVQRVVCGVNEKTTCQEVVIALAQAMGALVSSSNPNMCRL